MVKFAFRLWNEEEGQGVVEYALILVLITLLAIVSVKDLAVAAGRIYAGAAHSMAHTHAPGNTGNDYVRGAGQGWSQSGAGSSSPSQDNATENVTGSRTR